MFNDPRRKITAASRAIARAPGIASKAIRSFSTAARRAETAAKMARLPKGPDPSVKLRQMGNTPNSAAFRKPSFAQQMGISRSQMQMLDVLAYCAYAHGKPYKQLNRAYHALVVDHYENPRNVGSLDKNAANVGTGLVGAPACGDVMKLQIRVGEDGKIEEAKFKTFGCGSAIASSSYATDWLKDKSLDEALKIRNTDIAQHLNLPPVKLHCSMLAEDAVKAAIADFQRKKAKSSGADTTEPAAEKTQQQANA